MLHKNFLNNKKQRGVTLVELSVVLLILVALAGLVSPYFGGTGQKAMCEATDISMQHIKKVIVENYYVDTLGNYPAEKGTANYNLKCLFNACNWQDFDPVTNVGFRKGGYLQNGVNLAVVPNDSFKSTNGMVHTDIEGDQILDAWGKPIVIQKINTNFRLLSAGLDGIINTSLNQTAQLDDRIVYLNIPTPSNEQNTPCDQY